MIRFVLRWLLRALLLGLVTAIGLVLVRDRLLQEYLRHRLRVVSGFETRIGAVETHLAESRLAIRDLELINTPDFGGSPLIVVPELQITLDAPALRRRELRFREVRLHVAAFDLVRNARGETNVFRVVEEAGRRAGPTDAVVVSPPGLEFRGVATLLLTVGTVRFLDLAHPARNRALAVGITNETLREVRSPADLHPLVFRVLLRELNSHLGGQFRIGTDPEPPGPPATPSTAPP